MNYKEAITAWLVDDQLKFDISFDGGLTWRSVTSDYPPIYHPTVEYRVVPKKVKVKIASFGGDGTTVHHKRIVVDSTEYKDMETLPLFNRWLSDEITIDA